MRFCLSIACIFNGRMWQSHGFSAQLRNPHGEMLGSPVLVYGDHQCRNPAGSRRILQGAMITRHSFPRKQARSE